MRKNRFGVWTFLFVDKTEIPVPVGTAGKVGLDVGLNVLAATSDGRLLGRTFKVKFNTLYKYIKRVRANRQRQGLKENSRRLNILEQKLTGRIKTATGTIANRLVRTYPNYTFVVEDLNLKGCKGQKRFAYRELQTNLDRKVVTEGENPAYTSQVCPSCGYVRRGNRHGEQFRCRSCGRLSHADAVGAVNLLGRSGDKQIVAKTRPKEAKPILEARYRQRRNSSPRRKRSGLPLPLMPTVESCKASNVALGS
jgi:putative transposase